MSMIKSVKDFLATYTGLKDGLLLVDTLGTEPTQYAVMSIPGAKIVERYITGGSLREYPFAIQSTEYTADDAERINNSAFYEDLAEWFDSQSEAGSLPTLGTGKTASKIEATNWGFILTQGESQTGIYQITCKLTYEQNAP